MAEVISRKVRARNALSYLDWEQVEKIRSQKFLQSTSVKGIIRSSSEAVQELNVATLAAAADTDTGGPVFVVEDFPGIYQPRPTEHLAGLFLEVHAVRVLHSAHGVNSDVIFNTGNTTYDA